MEETLQSNRDCLIRDIQSKRLANYFIITVFSADTVPFQPHFNETLSNRYKPEVARNRQLSAQRAPPSIKHGSWIPLLFIAVIQAFS